MKNCEETIDCFLLLILIVLISSVFLFADKDKKAFDQQQAGKQAAMLKIRKIYVLDPHITGYWDPRHLAKGIEKSKCLTLEPDPSLADAVLAPVAKRKGWTAALDDSHSVSLIHCGGGEGCSITDTQSGPGAWTLVDPKTGNQVSDWQMDTFPSIKKVEQAVGCSE